MKTQKEIEEKYEILNKRMTDLMPSAQDVQELRDYICGEKTISGNELMAKIMARSSDSISTDAQRYILEWVLGQHD